MEVSMARVARSPWLTIDAGDDFGTSPKNSAGYNKEDWVCGNITRYWDVEREDTIRFNIYDKPPRREHYKVIVPYDGMHDMALHLSEVPEGCAGNLDIHAGLQDCLDRLYAKSENPVFYINVEVKPKNAAKSRR
jgi:hypothetical protein